MGTAIVMIMIMELLLAVICSTMNMLIEGSHVKELREIPGRSFWLMIGSWWLILAYLVPISLVVSMELIRLAQAAVMIRD